MNDAMNQKMKVSFNCRHCGTTVLEKILPQEEAMKAMNGGTFSKGGAPVLLGKAITKNLKCPGCNLDVVVPFGLARKSYLTTSVQSVGEGGSTPRASHPEAVAVEPEAELRKVERVVEGGFSFPKEVRLFESWKSRPEKLVVALDANQKVGA